MNIDDDAVVYLFFGALRRYKGLDALVSAFKQIRDDRVLLLIAGDCVDVDMRDHLAETAREDHRIRLSLGFVPDEEVSQLFGAADVFVAPFSRILTSSTVVLALSLGCPVIVPALGCLPELVDAQVGVLYPPKEDGALLSAMQEIRARDLYAMGNRARRLASTLDWHAIAKKTLNAYLAR